MQVQLKFGLYFNGEFCHAGDIISCSKAQGNSLIRQGYAVLVKEPEPKEFEQAHPEQKQEKAEQEQEKAKEKLENEPAEEK